MALTNIFQQLNFFAKKRSQTAVHLGRDRRRPKTEDRRRKTGEVVQVVQVVQVICPEGKLKADR